MKEKKRRSFTIEDKAKFLREYDRATHGDKKNVLAQWEIPATYVARWREELARCKVKEADRLAPEFLTATPKEVIEVSAEPGIDYLVNQATDHVTEARRLIDKARFMNGNVGVVSARFQSSLVSADEGLTLVLLDLAMASLCNDFW